jgi:hypothetical protein
MISQDKLNLLKSQLPISLNITMDMDYPNGIKENTIPFVKIAGTIGSYGVMITWKYEIDNSINIEYANPVDADEKIIPLLTLKEFLLKLKG